MQMEERKKKVLEAIILDYIATAEPVGSRTISKKYDLGVSPATVRNEMSDLEEMGLIEQPHTSAGRVPSQIGYRYYVDFLMERQTVSQDVKKYIRDTLTSQIKAAEDMVQSAVKLLSQMTNYTTLLLGTTYNNNILTHIQLLPLTDRKLVLILVLDNGHVEHRVLDMPVSLEEKQLDDISSLLRRSLCGLTVEQWRKNSLQVLNAAWDGEISLLQDILDSVEDALTVEYEHKLYLSGALNILNQPEFRDVDKVREILSLLEEDRVMNELLQSYAKNADHDVMIRIGRENPHKVLSSCSLVTATYHINNKVVGTVGVLGPTRMEYSKTASLLEYITKALSSGLSD
jgi:heat-inducible transcriptional repressor